jgi:hypothetical protein
MAYKLADYTEEETAIGTKAGSSKYIRKIKASMAY